MQVKVDMLEEAVTGDWQADTNVNSTLYSLAGLVCWIFAKGGLMDEGKQNFYYKAPATLRVTAPNPTQPILARADTNVKCTASSSSSTGLVVCFLFNCSDCPQLRYRDLPSGV